MARINPRQDHVYYAHYDVRNDLHFSMSGGRATVAMVFDDFVISPEGHEYPTKVSWAISWCAPHDKFNKLEGRQRASARVLDEKTRTSMTNFMPRRRSFSYYDLGKLLLAFEQARATVPSWARYADVW
jgi:hypothetical protein